MSSDSWLWQHNLYILGLQLLSGFLSLGPAPHSPAVCLLNASDLDGGDPTREGSCGSR
jgi:hypothetical protein